MEATGAPVWLHPDDLRLYEAVEQQGAMFGLQITPPPPPDHELAAGQTLELGSLRAEVRFVPGHSPGHVAFWFAAQQVVIAGDCLFAGSIGRTDLPGGSYGTLMDSIREQLLPLGDEVRVLPGHGPETTIGRERTSNPFCARDAPQLICRRPVSPSDLPATFRRRAQPGSRSRRQ